MEMNLALISIFTTILVSSSGRVERLNRVINGVPLKGRPTTYTAIRYYGAVATAHWEPLWNVVPFKYIKNWSWFGWVSCSGALIAPAVFQTACHCVAVINTNSKGVFKPPTLMNHWEDRKYIYLGVSRRFGRDSIASTSSVLTERFVMHAKCGKISEHAFLTYDYGIIILDPDWVKADVHTPYPFEEIEFAPQYSSEDIVLYSDLAQRLQSVCLHIGFGEYNPTGGLSEVLLHGWTALTTARECFREARVLDLDDKDIKQYMSWVCVKDFPKHVQPPGGGDSGGPVTCNNRYFAIVSEAINKQDDKGNQVVVRVHHSDLKHNLYVNAIEWRNSIVFSVFSLKSTFQDKTTPPTAAEFRFKFQDVGFVTSGLKLRSNAFAAFVIVASTYLLFSML